MSDEKPTSLRLGAAARLALAELCQRRRQGRKALVESLLLEANARDKQGDLLARVEELERWRKDREASP